MAASIRQKAWLNNSGTTITSCVVGSGQGLAACVAGNTIVVQLLTMDQTSTISSITDSAGNTYVLDSGPENICQAGGVVDTGYRRVYRASNITGAPTSVTITLSSASKIYMAVYELAAIRTSLPLDQAVHTATRTISTADSPAEQISFTTTFADEVALACYSSSLTGTLTPYASWVIDFNDSGSIAFMSRVFTAAGAYTAGITVGTTNNNWDFGADTYMGLGGAVDSSQSLLLLV